jgi:hypothetical protein
MESDFGKPFHPPSFVRTLTKQLKKKALGFYEHAVLIHRRIRDGVPNAAAEIDHLLTQGSIGASQNSLKSPDDFSANISVEAFLRQDFSTLFQKTPSSC